MHSKPLLKKNAQYLLRRFHQIHMFMNKKVIKMKFIGLAEKD